MCRRSGALVPIAGHQRDKWFSVLGVWPRPNGNHEVEWNGHVVGETSIWIGRASRHGPPATSARWSWLRAGSGPLEESPGGIAASLREGGNQVDLPPVSQVKDVSAYDAVICGSSVFNQRWMSDGQDFISANLDALADRPVWLFSVGTFGDRFECFRARSLRVIPIKGSVSRSASWLTTGWTAVWLLCAVRQLDVRSSSLRPRRRGEPGGRREHARGAGSAAGWAA